MINGHQKRGGQEQRWMADCKKKAGSCSGLSYTVGAVSIAGAEGEPVWVYTQLWDTGSDFNVVSGHLLTLLVGSQWRQWVRPLEEARSARLASGQTC